MANWLSSIVLGTLLSLFAGSATAQSIAEAAATGDTAAVRTLLTSDPVLVSTSDERGRMPLHIAAAEGHVEVARILIEAGAEVDAFDEAGSTPLQLTAAAGHMGVVDLLLASGADINAKHNRYGIGAVDLTFQRETQRGFTGMTEYLVSKGAEFDPNGFIRGGIRRLDMTVVLQSLSMTRYLVDLGADVNAETEFNYPPLVSAAKLGNAELVTLLLAAGADINAMDKESKPAILRAIEEGHDRVAEILFAHGASANLVEENSGRSLLHIAALGGHLNVVDLLLSRGSLPNTVDAERKTPLHYASQYGHRRVADRLIAAGATRDGSLVENYGISPHMTRDIAAGEAVAWYLNNRGWVVRTSNNVLVFDAEEWGVTRPADPSLANGFVTPAEIRDLNVIGLYTCYHGEIGEPAYLHEIEDSLSSVTYVQNAGDRWRGSDRSVYLSPLQDTVLGDAGISTIEVTHEMPSLGYLVQVDGLVIYYAGFRAEDLNSYREALEHFSQRVDRVDLAFVPLIDPQEQDSDYKVLLETLNPSAVLVLDPNRREEEYERMRDKALEWGFQPSVFTATNPGDAFVYAPSPGV